MTTLCPERGPTTPSSWFLALSLMATRLATKRPRDPIDWEDAMESITVLSDARAEILDEALAGIRRSHLGHDEAAGPEELRPRLETLFDIVLDCLEVRSLDRVVRHAAQIGRDRFNSGYGIGEVQTAFNVLEESMWRHVVAGVPTGELVEAARPPLDGARRRQGRARPDGRLPGASREHVGSLDLRALFEGT